MARDAILVDKMLEDKTIEERISNNFKKSR
jgi:hypothetical protein